MRTTAYRGGYRTIDGRTPRRPSNPNPPQCMAGRDAADEIVLDRPHLPRSMRTSRNVMARVARHLAEEHGIRRFPGVGTGLRAVPDLRDAI